MTPVAGHVLQGSASIHIVGHSNNNNCDETCCVDSSYIYKLLLHQLQLSSSITWNMEYQRPTIFTTNIHMHRPTNWWWDECFPHLLWAVKMVNCP